MLVNNNVILITGGTAGIGRELVKRFYDFDNQLIVTSSNTTNLEKLKEDFPKISILLCDLANPESVQSLVSTCLANHPEINMLINNAGVQYNYDWLSEENAEQKILDEITINFTSPMQIIYGLLAKLKEKDTAAIVNVSSGLALAPKRDTPIYCGTKAAVHLTTKALRYQFEDTNIKVFEIIPPLVDTAMTAGRGEGKISAEQLVDEFIRNFKKDKYESNIGKVKLLRIIQRISPRIADNILKGGK